MNQKLVLVYNSIFKVNQRIFSLQPGPSNPKKVVLKLEFYIHIAPTWFWSDFDLFLPVFCVHRRIAGGVFFDAIF